MEWAGEVAVAVFNTGVLVEAALILRTHKALLVSDTLTMVRQCLCGNYISGLRHPCIGHPQGFSIVKGLGIPAGSGMLARSAGADRSCVLPTRSSISLFTTA